MAKSLVIGLGGKGPGGSIGTTSVDLLQILEVARSGFGYAVSDDLIWTTFDLVSTDTDANVRYEMFKLDQIKEYATNYTADATNSDPVYISWASEGEVYKQTIVHDLTYEIKTEENIGALMGESVTKVRLAVQHSPVWEAGTAADFGGTFNSLGGTMAMNIGLANASYPSRILACIVEGFNDEFADHYTKVWAGIRDTRNGIAGFRSVWEAEKGSIYTDASRGTSASASNGTTVNITFAGTSTMAKRVAVKWSNIATANYDDICGRYLVLGRIKLSAGTVEVAAELRHGWLGFTGMESSVGVTYLSAVTDASLVNYNLIPLGVVDIPPTGDRDAIASSTAAYISSYGLALYAERLSAGGSMSLDCFVLIPNDHLMVVGSADINNFTGRRMHAFTGDDDISYAINRSQTLGYGNVEYSFENWNLPITGGVLVVAAQAGTIHQLNGSVSVIATAIPRFRGYRSS